MKRTDEKWRRMLPWVLIPLATFVVYLPAIHGGLIMDDAEHITPRALQSFAGLARIWFDVGATPHYYPVLNSVFWLEHHLWGSSPVGYHLANIIQHAGVACLVVLLARRLKLSGAVLAGLIFALHPVQVESVAWISEQKNTLSTLLGLGAALVYLDYRENLRRPYYWLASVLFLLALLTKTVVAVIPPALLVVVWWREGRLEFRRDVVPQFPWVVTGAGLGLFSAWFERVHSHAQGDVFQLSLLERTLIAGRAVCFYARTLVWPSDLMYINPRWSVDVNDPLAYSGVLLVIAAGVGLLVAARRWRGPLAAYLLFVGMLFPVLGFLNINWFNFSYVANHFQYLPSIGVIIPVAAVFQGALKSAGRYPVVAIWTGQGVLLAALGWAARTHCEEYRTPQLLYSRTVEKNPECWLAHNNLGVLLLEEPGQLALASRHFERALELKPDHARAHNNYGTALLRAGRLEEATVHYRRSLELQGDVAETHFNYGQALVTAGNHSDEAIAHFSRALELKSDYFDAHLARAEALAGLPERQTEAIEAYRAALAIAPDRAELHHGLAVALSGLPDKRDESIAHYREAIRLNPGSAEAYNNLATILGGGATTRDEALQLLTQAVRIAPEYADARFNLGMIFAEMPDRRDEAITQLREAVRLKPGDPEIRLFLSSMLLRYRRGLAEAALQLEEVVRLRPESAEAHVSLAHVLAQIPGRASEAYDHYRRALVLDPGNRAAKEALGRAEVRP